MERRADSRNGVWRESRWGGAVWGGPIPEAWVPGESVLGEAVLAGDDHVHVFETALVIISDGSFPPSGKRETLTGGIVQRTHSTRATRNGHRALVTVTLRLERARRNVGGPPRRSRRQMLARNPGICTGR